MFSDAALIRELKTIVGGAHVRAGDEASRRFLSGVLHGGGPAVAVVRPGSLVDLWRVARAIVRAGRIIIMQGANTGLTGGSTPDGDYDRGVIIINTMRLKGIHLLNGGAQVVCLPGATLLDLGNELRPLQREPHSETGSSSLGASVAGGVCNNASGALVRRGPAYTEAAIYAQVDATGELRLINELGIDLGRDPEEQLEKLERGDFARIVHDMHEKRCSAADYIEQVRDLEAPTPARFNGNPRYLKGASGSAGRVVVFALRLDTFPAARETRVFHLATEDAGILSEVRRRLLGEASLVPAAAEYMHRDVFRMAAIYGKDVFLASAMLGAGQLPLLFRMKAGIDDLACSVGRADACLSDRVLQGLSRLMPPHLPEIYRQLGAQYTHHLLLRVDDIQAAAVQAVLAELVPAGKGAVHDCSPAEGRRAFRHASAATGAVIRYAALRRARIGGLVSLDVALRRNDKAWFYVLPDHLKHMVEKTLVYGHFLCHVFHHDFILKKGADAAAFRRGMLAHYSARGAESPAGHNVGHLYRANKAQVDFFRKLDPTNSLNPGIGQTSRNANWR
jgi:D-lactate dehydrogenase (quinone)